MGQFEKSGRWWQLLSLLISFSLHDERMSESKNHPQGEVWPFQHKTWAPYSMIFQSFFSIFKLSSTSSFLWRRSVHYRSLRSAASLFRNASLIFVKVVSVRTKKKKKLLAKLSSIVIYRRLNRWCYREWFIEWNSLRYLISKMLEYASNTFMNYLCMIKSITF